MYSNSTLIALLKQGDETAFKAIYDRYYYPILKNIAKWESDSSTQEDLLQEVFMQLWNKREGIADGTDIGGWLFRASYHMTMSHLRKALKISLQSIDEREMAHSLIEEDGAAAEERHLSKLSLLQSAIELLPEQKKKTFLLYKVQGLSYDEIASQMGISELSVRQYVKMAVSHLRKTVKLSEVDLYVCCLVVFSAPVFC